MPGGRERSFGQPRQGPPRGLKARDPGSRPSAHVEAAEAFWLLDLDLHCGHACSLRAVTAPLDELVHRFGVAFDDYFHPAVREVARPAGDAERERLLCAATAVPNPLDSAPDPEVPADHLQKLAPTHHVPIRRAMVPPSIPEEAASDRCPSTCLELAKSKLLTPTDDYPTSWATTVNN
jgi:hypothetical protein